MMIDRYRIELIPINPTTQIRGFLGIDTEVTREGDRVELESIGEFL